MSWRRQVVNVPQVEDSPVDEAGRIFLDLLEHPHPFENKHWEAWKLGSVKDQQSGVRYSQRLAQLPQPVYRQLAVTALSQLRYQGSRDAELVLRDLVKDPEPAVRRVIPKELRDPKDPFVQEILKLLALDPVPSVRAESARYLPPSWDSEAMELCLAHLKDPEAVVRESAVANPGWLDAEGEYPPAFFALMDDPSPAVRTRLADSLFYSSSEQAVPCLHRLARDSDPSVRAMAVDSLKKHMKAPETLEILLEATQDADDAVRVAATAALSQQDDARSIEALLGCAKDSCRTVRYQVTKGLERWATPDMLPVLLRLAEDDEHVQIRRSIARTLARIPGLEAEACLARMLEDSCELVRKTARKVLMKRKGLEAITMETALELKYGRTGAQATRFAFRGPGRPSSKAWEKFLGAVTSLDGVPTGSAQDRPFALLEATPGQLTGIMPFGPTTWLWIKLQTLATAAGGPAMSYDLLPGDALSSRLTERKGYRVLAGEALLRRIRDQASQG